MSNIIEVNDETFQAEILESDLPVLVDFGAAWCGPCKQLKPLVEDLAGEYEGRLKVAYVDIDQARETAVKYGIMSVPTVLYMRAGEVAEQQSGLTSKGNMIAQIDGLLAGGE